MGDFFTQFNDKATVIVHKKIRSSKIQDTLPPSSHNIIK